MNSGIVVLVVIFFSFLRWLFQQIAARAEKRRQQQLIERQELERLRTGRIETQIVEEEPSSPRAARESEARRREELAELRRRAAARRQPQTGLPPSSPNTPRRSSAPPLEVLLGLPPGSTTGGIVTPTSRAAAKDRGRSRALKPQRPQATGAQPDPEVEAQRRAQLRREADVENAAAEVRRKQEALERQRVQDRARALANRSALASQGLDQRLLREATPIGTGTAAQRAGVSIAQRGSLVPRTASEWRRAIIMNEVLNKPVSLR